MNLEDPTPQNEIDVKPNEKHDPAVFPVDTEISTSQKHGKTTTLVNGSHHKLISKHGKQKLLHHNNANQL